MRTCCWRDSNAAEASVQALHLPPQGLQQLLQVRRLLSTQADIRHHLRRQNMAAFSGFACNGNTRVPPSEHTSSHMASPAAAT
jgi:hypothetical protein